MKLFVKLHLSVIFFLTISIWFDVHAQSTAGYADRQVIVKLKEGVQLSKQSAMRTGLNAKVLHKFSSIGAELWEIPGVAVADAISLYKNDARIEYIEPNYRVSIIQSVTNTTPNDPRYPEMWGLSNTGQSGGTVDADIDAPEAWDIETGDEVVVGVIDTGVDWGHEDLVGNIWTNPNEIAGNNIDDDSNGYIDDIRGWDFINNDNDPFDDNRHGTHVSGTIAAVGNNGIGTVGVSWTAKIMGLKFLDANGSGSISDAILAVEYATMMGAKLTNNSWGGGGFSQAMYDAIEAAKNADILFIAAAGNDGTNNDASPHYPSNYDLANIISVASTDRNDQRSSFSNFGAISVDLGAPGSSILSTFPNDTYGTINGTSMATPHVTGAASLLWAQTPGASHTDVKNKLMIHVDPIAALAGITVTGGRLNIYNALLIGAFPLNLTENGGGQATNAFDGTISVSSAQLFRFGFNANDEAYNIGTGLTLGTSTIGITSGDFANLDLIQDTNNNGTIEGGETSVGTIESPLDISDGITLSNFIIPQGSPGYILTGDVNNLVGADQLIISLSTGNITNVTGATSGGPITPFGSVSSATHTVPTEALIWNPTTAVPSVANQITKRKGARISPAATQKNLELTAASANELATALSALNIANTTVTDLSNVSLSLYKYVFVVLGQYDGNHIITNSSPNATALENYLAGGGKVYMEGGDVWYWDHLNAGGHDFGPSFGITALSDGANGSELSTIDGLDFIAGQDFAYAGGDNYPDHLSGTGVVIHSNTSPAFDCGVANINATSSARTIGTSFEFGQLVDGASPATKTELMQTYIDFFDGGEISGIVFRVERATGNVFASSFIGSGADLAERINVSEPVEFGDVVELDPNKPEHYRKTRGSSQLIAGVITTEPGFTLGNNLKEKTATPLIANAESITTSHPMLALMGRVPVKVTTENGAIQPGDLLTISSKPGYAMRCTAAQKDESAIIGKALEGLEKGKGTILVLVTAH